jgi:hypothetical protein
MLLSMLLSLSLAQVGRPVLVTIPPNIEPDSCTILALIVGPFGSMATLVERDADVRVDRMSRTFAISTLKGGITGRSLKVWLSCRGHEVAMLDFPTLDSSTTARVSLLLRHLPTLRFEGTVIGFDSVEPLDVEANYYPWWRCEFFLMAECGMSGQFVVAVPLGADGRFSVQLPDYLQQPEIGALTHRGEFEFVIRSRSSGKLLYRLVSPSSPSGRVAAQASYPIQYSLRAVPVK